MRGRCCTAKEKSHPIVSWSIDRWLEPGDVKNLTYSEYCKVLAM